MSDMKTSESAARCAVRSLSVGEWPDADRNAWAEAIRLSVRLKPGGSASHLAPISQEDFAQRILRQLDLTVSAPMATAINAVPYTAATKIGLQMKRRF